MSAKFHTADSSSLEDFTDDYIFTKMMIDPLEDDQNYFPIWTD